jgi:myo-inositol-1(or 4)-monophosphatase
MTHPFQQISEWEKLTQGIMQLAKQEILTRFEKVAVEIKSDGTLLTEADTQMQIKTQEFLAQHWPQFAFLGEESSPSDQCKSLKSSNGCWVLDPVDGTSNFASGIPFFSVSLALVIQGEIVAGLVYDPSREELFSARKGMGAYLNDLAIVAKTPKANLSQCIGIIDFKRLSPQLALELAQKAPFASQRSFGSVALDWCWIAMGRGQIYCHGAQNIWDYAAGWLILEESGGQSTTLDNEWVVTAQVSKRSAIAATTPQLFEEWQTYIFNQLKNPC